MMGGSGLPISTRTLVPLEQFRQDEVRAVKAIREGLAKATGKQAYQITAVEVLASPEAKKLNFAPTDEPFVNQMFQQRTETFLAPPNLAGLQKVDFTDQTLAFLNYATMKPQFTPGDQDNWSDLRTVFQPDATGKSTYVVAKIHQVLDVEAKPSQGNTPARPAQHNDATLWVGPISERVLDTEIDKAKANAAQQQAILKLEKVDTRSVELYASADGSHLALAFPPGPERPHTVRPAIQLSYFANTKDEIKKIQSSPSGPQGLPEAKTIDLAVATGATVPWFMFALTIAFGIGMAFAIEFLTDYYVSTHKKPVQEVAGVATAGPAPMIIQGFALALESSVFMVFSIVFALIMPLVFFPPSLYGGMILSFYGVALVGLGLLTTTGYVLAMDTFGPISDNAQGVFEMSGEGHGNVYGLKAVQRLDAAGNTTKALTKGFAIATAVVAAVALFHSYLEASKLQAFGLRLDTPEIFLGLLIGGAAPYLFSASTINAVGRASFQLINEVRRQFRSDPGIMTRTSKPDYARCVSIVTAAAQKELIGPAILAIALPIAVGFGFSIGKAPTIINGQPYNLTGAQALGGFLAGAILSGQLMAVLLANSGGIWDNAKKLIEDGMHGGKGTEAHKAGVVVDTVGDPFKDTAGPALNPLIKVMNLVALLLAPIYIRPFGNAVLVTVTVTAVALLAVSIWWSKRGSMSSALAEAKHEEAAALAAATDGAPPDQPKAKKKLTVDD
ncbi:MAG: sodium/proton-translocating pyrophosphatase [Fimbriimonas ginsengisoli]|uniref:Sodium/proton-translocating pyrophosphatase n=1 Tax=Fimbriimonas ginsengisoli TaxID=1005039 RepID=A0A931PT07_FIMGI|nr:sodium/proton-translocating pyrophosphatase [Fimbriimonas ginsengisoli]